MHDNEKIVAWAQDHLAIKGYTIDKPYELVCAMPWSRVIRFSTQHGLVYCKQMIPLFYIEPALMQMLSQCFPANIPKVIASNSDLCCFLMHDACTPLRGHLKTHYQTDLFCKALKAYASIQYTTIKHVDTLLSVGLQDWRLAKLPALYLQLINNTDLLKADGYKKQKQDIWHYKMYILNIGLNMRQWIN